METTITLQQQREMLINEIAKYKAEGKAIELENAEYDLRQFDEAKPTGLKYKNTDGKVYETFTWSYVSHTGGKKWQHGYKYESKWGVMTGKAYKKECFK